MMCFFPLLYLDMPDAKPVTQQKPETEQEEQLGMEEKAALGTSPEETAAGVVLHPALFSHPWDF